MKEFKDLGLSPEMLKTLEEIGFKEPTEIQEKTIPLALAGKDIIGESATGSGKTLAFGASIIEHVKKGEGLQALILAPTRELAEQVGKSLKRFSRHRQIEVAIVYGGVGINPQIDSLRESEIAVGTPGRILDHMERRTIDFRKIRFLVLDEADKMLDMGFVEDVEHIIAACPKERQTLLFSATISPDIARLSKKYMRNHVEVSAESYVDPAKLTQVFYDVPKDIKFSLLVSLLKNEKAGLVMVFCNTRRNADFVGKNLIHAGVDALVTHGGLTQERRNRIISKFHSGHVCVLICTDVAARGLDIKNVSHVYNYDLPNTSKEYIHRIGRTARAGEEGKVVNIVSDRDYDNFRRIMQDPSLKIEKLDVPNIEKLPFRTEGGRERRFSGGGFRRGGFGERRGFGDRGGDGRGFRREGRRDGNSRGFRGRDGRGRNSFRR